jgi:hypothetical protein
MITYKNNTANPVFVYEVGKDVLPGEEITTTKYIVTPLLTIISGYNEVLRNSGTLTLDTDEISTISLNEGGKTFEINIVVDGTMELYFNSTSALPIYIKDGIWQDTLSSADIRSMILKAKEGATVIRYYVRYV